MRIDQITAAMLDKAVIHACAKYKTRNGKRMPEAFVEKCKDSREVLEYVQMMAIMLFQEEPDDEKFANACLLMLTALSIGIDIGLTVSENSVQ